MASEFVATVALVGRVPELTGSAAGRGVGRASTPSHPPEQSPRQEPPDADRVSKAVEKLNELVQNQKRSLYFSVDQDTGRTVIRVIDPDTSEVIRQIPPEEVLNLARLHEGAGGVLLRALA
jgi:flagellar protein FlaG